MNKNIPFFSLLLHLTSVITLTSFTIQSNGPNPVDLKTLLAQHNKQTAAQRQQQQQQQQQKIKNQPVETVIKKPDHKILTGLIQKPNISTLPEIKILFNGQQTSTNSEGFYSFLLEKNSKFDECSILICNHVCPIYSNINTIENLTINKSKNYKFFELKKITLKENKYVWKWEQQNLEQNNFIIPNHCIIVLINPKYFEKIENPKIHLMDSFIGLPKIILKNDIPTKKLSRTGIKSHLYTLDHQYFHETIKQEKKIFEKQPNIQVFLAK